MPVTFTLWHNADPSGDNKWLSETFTGAALKGYAGDTGTDLIRGDTCLGVVVSWQVEPQPRAPTVLVANQGETTLLPGYGIHYNGEQQFYAFYIDVTGSSSGSKDPFQTDPTNPNGVLNVVLLSRATYLETNLSTNLSTNNLTAHLPALASCLGSSNVTARNPGGSQMGLAGTFSGSMNDSCANLLLQNLMPRNSTGNVTGTYFHVPALVALGDFLENLPAELAAVGQVTLGVLSTVYQVVSAAVAAAISVLNFLVKLIELIFTTLINALVSSLVNQALSAMALPMLSLLYNGGQGNITLAQFNGLASSLGLSLSPLGTIAMSNAWLALGTGVLAVAAALITVGTIAYWSATAISDGAAAAIAVIADDGLEASIPAIIKSVAGFIGPVIGLTSALLLFSSTTNAAAQLGFTGKAIGALGSVAGVFLTYLGFQQMKSAPVKFVIELADDISSLMVFGLEALFEKYDPSDLTVDAKFAMDGVALYFAATSIFFSWAEGPADNAVKNGLSPTVNTLTTIAPYVEAGAAVVEMGQLSLT